MDLEAPALSIHLLSLSFLFLSLPTSPLPADPFLHLSLLFFTCYVVPAAFPVVPKETVQEKWPNLNGWHSLNQ